MLLSFAGLWAAHLQPIAFAGIGVVALGVAVFAALHAPRATVVIVALSAVLDRYIVAVQLPAQLSVATHFTSEVLLATVAVALTWRAWRAGDLLNGFRHPATAFLLAFVLLAVASAIVNAVRPAQALAGLLFTLDAAALFYLARLAQFDLRAARRAVVGLVGLVVAAAAIAVIQALIRPDVFGLTALAGRFGETYRLASIFGDPNVFGALISAALPFAILATTRAPLRRERAVGLSVSFVLVVALWLSFSRGGWLGMIVGFGATTLVLDRRALLVGAALLLVGFLVVNDMPRGLSVPPAAAAAQGRSSPLDASLSVSLAPAISKRPGLVASTVDRVSTVASGKDLRTLFILNAVPIFGDHAALGVGPGEYGGAAADAFGTSVYRRYGSDKLFHGSQRTVDNFWLHLTVESGALGISAFLGALVLVLLPIFRVARGATGWRRIVLVGIAAASVALIVNSLTTMLLESNSVAFLFWLLLGIGSTVAAAPVISPLSGATSSASAS